MSTDAIDTDVELLTEPLHDSVRFRFANTHGEPVAVRLEQPIRPGIAVHAEYNTEAWQSSENSLVFVRKLETDQTVETSYNIGGVDTSTILDLLQDVTVEVRDLDGADLGSLEGTDLDVRGQILGTDTRADDPGGTDLPGSILDYVLRDVGDVQPSEFAWTSL